MIADEEAGRLADALTDPTDRKQEDRRCDRDENIVEAGNQPELLFVGNRGRSQSLDMSAQCVGRVGGYHSRCDGVIQLLL